MLKVGTIITEKIESRGGSAGRCFNSIYSNIMDIRDMIIN